MKSIIDRLETLQATGIFKSIAPPFSAVGARDHVIRFVVTHVNKDGVRTLCAPSQGRNTHESAGAAAASMQAMVDNNRMENGLLAGVYGLPLEVRAVECYPGHYDPLRVYFDRPPEILQLELSEVDGLIKEAFPGGEEPSEPETIYDMGFRDAMESVVLALCAACPELESGKLKQIVTTVIDAYGNNAPDFDELSRPSNS